MTEEELVLELATYLEKSCYGWGTDDIGSYNSLGDAKLLLHFLQQRGMALPTPNTQCGECDQPIYDVKERL